jgi:hypothetical protein
MIGCQGELKIAEGGPGSCRDTHKRRKSDRPLLPGKEKIMRNIHCRPRQPSIIQEFIEVMKQHPIKDSPLRMSEEDRLPP